MSFKYKVLTKYYNLKNYLEVNIVLRQSTSEQTNLLSKSQNRATAILNIWKRDHLHEQIESLLNQTQIPYEIWILQCRSYIDIRTVLRKYPFVHFIHSTKDLKYFGRFSLAHHVESEYVFIIDDDVIPGVNWLENCQRICKEKNAIVASAGRIIPDNNLYPERLSNVSSSFVADVNPLFMRNHSERDTVVDFGCNSWFFKTEWLNEFWKIAPYAMDTGEDIHLSASCKIASNIPTIVPAQIDEHSTGNLKKHYGQDALASWKTNNFLDKRAGIIKHLTTQHGWKPILWTEKSIPQET